MGSVSHHSENSLLFALSSALPGLPIATPSSPDYSPLREAYALTNTAVPLAIARPQTIRDVAVIVPLAQAHGVKITVRSGGHDVFGRSIMAGVLVIDMRDLKSVAVSEDKITAKIGGGILMGDVIEELSKYDLVTPFGSVPGVGYAGWSTLGGYGALSGKFGLGVDQIVAAKLVNWKGEIVEADSELLKGIRGAAGNFGVIVELKIKVYPLKTLLAGMVVFESNDISTKIQDFQRGYQNLDLPAHLGHSFFMLNHPQFGRIMTSVFVWSSDDREAGMKCLAQIEGLGPVVANTVAELTPIAWLRSVQAVVPMRVWGSARTISLPDISESTAKIIAAHAENLPTDLGCGLVIHENRGVSAQKTPSSCFGGRQSHFMLELLGSVLDPSNLDEAQAWIMKIHDELRSSGVALVGEYPSLSQPGDVRVSDFYGDSWEFVKHLKQKYDPEGVFSLAVPRLIEG